MKIYRGKIAKISTDIVRRLCDDNDIEVMPHLQKEVVMDIEAILSSYIAEEDRINRIASEQAGPDGNHGEVRKLVAREAGFRLGDEGIEWVINQILESFMINNNVEEVYTEDNEMRRKIVLIFRKHLDIDEDLDAEVRSRIKHLEEGSTSWEHEYRRVRVEVEKKRGLV